MTKKHLEKQHYILELKLKKAKAETDQLRANPKLTIAIVLVFTFFIGPTYTQDLMFSESSASVISRFGGNYLLAAVTCGIVCLVIFLLYIFVFDFEKKKRIKRLTKEKKAIEAQLKSIS